MKLKLGFFTALAMSASAWAAEGEGLKVGGFVDAQYNWGGGDQPNINTFLLNDGALYLGKTVGAADILIDIPFSYTLGAQKDGNANNFAIATQKAQAFVSWKYDNGFGWKAGQFDSILGLEAVDSVDVVFAKRGLIAGNMPFTHTGLLLSYELSDLLGLHMVMANPYNRGRMESGNLDFGFKVASKFDTFKASVAALFISDSSRKGYIVDINAGTKLMEKLSVDLEVSFDKARSTTVVPSSNTTTGVTTTTITGAVNTDSRFGGGIHLGYALNEKLNAATRFEYTKMDVTKVMNWSVGPQWWASKDTVLKLDYTLRRTDAGVVATTHFVNVAAVQKF